MISGIAKFYTQEFELKRLTVVENDIGGYTESWEIVQTGLCRIRPLSGNEQMSADKLTVFSTHKMYCAVMEVTETDKIVVDDVYYNIKFVKNPMTMNNHLEIDLEVIK